MKKIAIISMMPTHPPEAGNSVRLLAIAQQLIDSGHDVHYIYIRRWQGDDVGMQQFWGDRLTEIPYSRPATPLAVRISHGLRWRFGINWSIGYRIDDWYDESAESKIMALHEEHQFDAVIVHYVFLSRVLDRFGPDVRKLIDTQDVFANRNHMQIAAGQVPGFFYTSESEEARGLQRADAVMAIQDHEAAYYRRMKSKEVFTVGHAVKLCQEKVCSTSNRTSMLFVGSSNPFNRDAILFFIESVLPLIRRECPECRLLIGGAVCNQLEDDQAYEKLGRLERIEQAYEQAAIVVSPLRSGTGLKIKTIEALGYGCPVVATREGARGLEDGEGRGVLVADEPETFVRLLSKLIRDNDYYREQAAAALTYAAEYNLKCREQLLAAIN